MKSLYEKMDDLIEEMRTIRRMATGLLAMMAAIDILLVVILIQVRSM